MDWFRFRKRKAKLARNHKGNRGFIRAIHREEKPAPFWSRWNGPKPKSAFENGRAFGYFLQRRGYKRLGNGAYSTVYAKGNSDRVIKVCGRPDGWVDYIDWASKCGQLGIFAPLVYSYKYIKGTKHDFYIAVVERLQRNNHSNDNDPHILTDRLLCGALGTENPIIRKCADLVVPGLMGFTDRMKLAFPYDSSNYDLHGGNWMLRKDGSFVLTDPLCGGMKTDVKRLKYAA